MRGSMLAAVLLAGLAAAPGLSQDRAAAIQAVISQQIDAFRADDLVTAFGFASPGIRQMFGDPANFGQMVRQGYPMVWRPAQVRFSGLADRDGRLVQSVLMTDASGALYIVDYQMIPGEDGGWRIDGVTVRHSDDAGA